MKYFYIQNTQYISYYYAKYQATQLTCDTYNASNPVLVKFDIENRAKNLSCMCGKPMGDTVLVGLLLFFENVQTVIVDLIMWKRDYVDI